MVTLNFRKKKRLMPLDVTTGKKVLMYAPSINIHALQHPHQQLGGNFLSQAVTAAGT